MPMPLGLRDILRRLSPPWKTEGDFEKYDYSISTVADLIMEKISEAVAARNPRRTKTATSLLYIGDDRIIPKGLTESDASYAVRLQRAYDDWQLAGSARAVISQVLGFLGPAVPRIVAVTALSGWDYVPVNSSPTTVPTHLQASPANWRWDWTSNPNKSAWWWRVWFIIDATGWATAAPVYGAGGKKYGATDVSWGLGISSKVIDSIRSIVKLWKGQQAWVEWLIVNFDVGTPLFNPVAVYPAASLPDGVWGPWSKIEVVGGGLRRSPSRSTSARYCSCGG